MQAIDQSEKMIERAIANVNKMALDNVDYHVMDAEQLEFKSSYFDAAICSFGLFFLPDMAAALQSWKRVLKPGGVMAFTSFAASSFQPMADIFREQLQEYGVDFESTAWQKLSKPNDCHALLDSTGLNDIDIRQKQMGYHLNKADDWWDVLWHSGFRGLLLQLQPSQLEEFRKQHLDAVRELQTDKGLWLDIDVIFSSGRKPHEH